MNSLGAYLKSKREEKGLALEEMAEKTRIPLRYLSAVEEDRLNDLPGKVYERLFIRTYADLVGVNVDELAREFREIQNTLELRIRPEAEARSPMLKRGIWGLGLLALVLVLILFFTQGKEEKKPAEPVKPQAVPNLVPVKPMDSVAAAAVQPPEKPKLEGLNLELETTDSNWVRLLGDDKIIFEGELKRGEKKSVRAEKKIKISLGRAWAGKVVLNGHPLKRFGKEGSTILDFELTKDNYPAWIDSASEQKEKL